MADYFTYFSVDIDLPSAEAQTYALDLAQQASRAYSDEKPPDSIPAELAGVIEDWRFETETRSKPGSWGIWMHTESGGVDALCAFIQHLLKRFQPKGRVGFGWSDDCSKPRVGAFGGSAAVVTARKIKHISTHEWLRQHGGGPTPD